MSFLSRVQAFLAGHEPRQPTPKASPSPVAAESKLEVLPNKIYVEIYQRMGGGTYSARFAGDKPDLAFAQALEFLASQPLLYDSMKGVRTDASCNYESLFTVSAMMNYGTGKREYTLSFPGSWQPTEALQSIQQPQT